MRVIVILKSNKYYVAEQMVSSQDDTQVFRLCSGGRVVIRKDNIDSIETYGDNEIEYGLRPKLSDLENNPLFVRM